MNLRVAALLMLLLAGGIVTSDDLDPSTLTVAVSTDVIRFHPHTSPPDASLLVSALYEGLTARDPDTLSPVPAVASSWTLSEDAMRVTLFLRTDARFADGEPILASHFRDSWISLLDPATGSPYAYLLDGVSGAVEYRTGRIDDPDEVGVHARAPRILEIELRRPDHRFTSILSHPSLVPIHPSRSTSEGIPGGVALIIGNGPYRVESVGEPLRLVRSESYWNEDTVGFERVDLYSTLTPSEVSIRFNSGSLDWAMAEFDVDRLSDIGSIHVNPLYATTYLYFNARNEPWSNVLIRRDLVRVIPAEDLRPLREFLPPAVSLVPSTPLYPEVRGIEQIDDRQLLRNIALHVAGEADSPVSIRIPDTKENERVSRVLAETWESVLGLDVEVEIEQVPATGTASGTHPTLALETTIGAFINPVVFLDRWRSDNPQNPSGYADPEFDRLLAAAADLSGAARMRALASAEQRLLDSGLIIPVCRLSSVHLIDLEKIGGFRINPLDYHPISSLYQRHRSPAPGVVLLPVEGRTVR